MTSEAGYVVRAGVLVDGTGVPAREDMAFAVTGDRLGEVLPWREHPASSEPDAANVWDLSDATVVPGLIDAHAHVCSGSPDSPSWRYARKDPSRIVAWGLASVSAALRAGVTTIQDVGSRAGLALVVRDLIRHGIGQGPDVLAAGRAITTTAGHGEHIGMAADSADELRKAVRSLVAADVDIIKIMVTGGATDPHTNRRRAQYSEAELAAAFEDAHRLGQRVVGHANATDGIVRAVAAGIDIVAHCNWLGEQPRTVTIDWPTVDRMAKQGTFIDLNLQGATRALGETDGEPIDWEPSERHRFTCRWDVLQPVRERGVELYLSSDAFGPAVGSFSQGLADAAAQWQIDCAELISLVTSAPARGLGLAEDRGALREGLRADFCVLPGDLRADMQVLSRPQRVIKAGEPVAGPTGMELPVAARAHREEAAAQGRLLKEVFTELN